MQPSPRPPEPTSGPPMQSFAVRYDRWSGWLLGLLGHGRRFTRVELDPEVLRVRMGFGFRSEIPRGSIVGVHPYDGSVYGWGVHGWRGVWLVNGSSRGIAAVDLDPPVAATVLFVPISLRRLLISLEDRDGFTAALQPAVS